MTQEEKKYLAKRVLEVSQIKKEEVGKSIPVIQIKDYLPKLILKSPMKFMPFGMIAKQLRDKLSEEKRFPNYTRVFDTAETKFFRNFDEVQAAYNKAVQERQDKINSKSKEINQYVTKMTDEIMLGNAEEALKQLQEFEKKKF